MKTGPKNKEEVFALLIRRRWWIAVPFLALSAAAALFVYVLPSAYVSEALILVRPRDVPEAYVPDVIGGGSEQRLAAIERTVLSRTNLSEIVRKFSDQLPELEPLSMDQKISRLGEQIDIDFEIGGGRTASTVTSFRITYQNQNARLAQAIAREITTLFIQEDNADRESQVVGTTDFFEARLEEARVALEASERELEDIRRGNQNSLPEQLDRNLRTLELLATQQQTNTEATALWTTTLLNIQQRLALTPEFLAPAEAAALDSNPVIAQYIEARSAFESVAGRYTEAHPEVVAARRELERLRAQLPPEFDEGGGLPEQRVEPTPNPEYEELAAQIRRAETELDLRESESRRIEADMQRFTGHVDNTFATEQLISEVSRRNNDVRGRHDELQASLDAARLSESLEFDQRGSRFQVLDPASLPGAPTRPNKLAVLLASILGSLALSAGFAVAVDVARQKIWTQSEIEALWGVPVLVDIPEIVTDSDVADLRRRKLALALSSAGATAAYAACLYLMYLNSDFILRRLDPLIQRLVY